MASAAAGKVRSPALALVLAAALALGAGHGLAQAQGTLVFADGGWDSIIVYNRIAGFIAQHGYGYTPDYVPGETIPLFTGLRRGDVDINMEVWIENQLEAYEEGIAAGDVIDLGPNFSDSVQGWFVPRYVVEGDPERGIEPMAPGLRTVFDLPRYWQVFEDPEEPGKGRYYDCIAGWECEKINEQKFEAYGLNETYNRFLPGSGAALAASLVAAYERGEPWFGYYWGPTWIFGQLDLVQIEEPPYSDECWATDRGCAYPSVRVHIVVNSDLPRRAPEIVEFLRKFETSMQLASEVLAYMQEGDASAEETARWFLRNYEDLWTRWVPGDVAARVKAAL